MGEFLLSFLGFGEDGTTIVFTRKLKGSHYKAGDAVPFVYPNPQRKTKRVYLRILEKFYDPEVIAELIRTQDPLVIDKNDMIASDRRLQDAEIYKKVTNTVSDNSFLYVGLEIGWHKLAVEAAVKRHSAKLEQEKRDAREALVTQPQPQPQQTKEESQKHINELLANWGD